MRGLLGVTAQGFESFPKTGPAIVIAPHVSFVDPIAVFIAVPRPVRFLASAYFVFRSSALSWVPYLAGAVPIVRHRPDPAGVLRALRLLSHGEVIGLFPEGGRSWTGVPETVMPQAARLLASAACPIYVVAILGAYDRWPRWAPAPMRRRVTVRLIGPLRMARNRRTPKARGGPFAVFAPRGRGGLAISSRAVVRALCKAAAGEAESLSFAAPGRLAAVRVFLPFCPFCARAPLTAESGSLSCGACGTRLLPATNGTLRYERTQGVPGDASLRQLALLMGRQVIRRARHGLEIEGSVEAGEFAAGEGDPSATPLAKGEAALSRKGLRVRFGGQERRLPLERFRLAQIEGSHTLEIPSEDASLRLHLKFDEGAMRWIVAGRALLGLRPTVPGP